MKEYRGYSTLLVVALLFVIPLLFSPAIGVNIGASEEKTESIQLESGFQTTDTDLTRVEWALNQYENPGFESWTNPHNPSNVNHQRSTEHFTGYSTSNVSEGGQSMVMQAKAVDPTNPADQDLHLSSWVELLNPINLTVRFDWIVDALPVPVDGDYFTFQIRLGSPGSRYLNYYLGCENTVVTNSTYYHYYMIEAAASGWNTFDRNITEDFFDMAGVYPTEFEYFRYDLRSTTNAYSRVYVDDLRIVNGTVIVGGATRNGDFESISEWNRGNNDPSDIVQSIDRVEGDWSLNATSVSNGNRSYASFASYPDKRLTSTNVDRLQFQWKIDDFSKATSKTYAYLYVGGKNETDEFSIYYPLCYGGNSFPLTYSGYLYVNATGFNSTGQWNQFDRSIWDDITSYNSTTYLIIEEIEIKIFTEETDARISILFDDISFTCAPLNDRGYEDHGDVGDEIWAWDISSGTYPEFSLTDEAYDGSRAGNLTVADGNSYGAGQEVGYLQVNNETDLWLDFWWRFENFTGLTDDLLYLEVYFEDGENFAYIFGNGSSVYVGNGFDEFIILPENGTEGTWFNFQRNLYDDYLTLYGTEPSTSVYQFYLNAEAGTGGRVSMLLDDVYLYIDPEPGIENLYQTPSNIEADEEVEITVDIIEASLDTVNLYYSVDSGPWITQSMLVKTGNTFNASIPGQVHLSQVQYYVSANDTFGNSIDSAVDLGLIYGYDVVDTINPEVSITSPEHDATVGGVVSVTVETSDAGSGISYVEIYIEEVMVANLSAGPFTYSWDTTTLDNGTYAINAKAFDGAGNSGQVTHIVLVQNAVTPTTSTTPEVGDMTPLIIAIAIAAGVVVVIVLYFLQKKGKAT